MTAPRWFSVGSAGRTVERPGTLAASRAGAGDDAKLVVVFCSPSLDPPEVVRQIRSACPGVPLIGCTTAGEFATGGPDETGVVVVALGGEGFAVRTAVTSGASKDLRAAGARAARCLPQAGHRPHRALLLLTDGLAGDQQEIVRGAYGVLGAEVPLVGGCAGDDLAMTRTYQFFDDEVISDSVVAAGIASDAPMGIGVRHGWKRVGEPMLVTKADGNQVFTLDDRPALDSYLAHLGVADGSALDEPGFRRLAMTHPLGLSRREQEEHVRFIGGADFSERSLSCIAEVPQGGLVWMMEGDAESVLAATDAACRDAVDALGGRPPIGLFAFDCIARRGVLGDDNIMSEMERIATPAAGAPVAGFYTYGEIARTRGVHGFHNQTLVVLSMA
ncbi:MAG TPA: FIST N-terminal domain-containing protein [Acidimicrobiales bacterium]|nr:FIST N-terminal domain-containing protein [Acidimicrobiales bacterium]